MTNAYYFLFSESRDMPFPGGWAKVLAKNRREAKALFRAVHPDVNLLPVYEDFLTEREMDRTGKHSAGHRGHYCREVILADNAKWRKDPEDMVRVISMAIPRDGVTSAGFRR